MIKVVLFDIDGVLLDSKEANINFLRNLLEKSSYKRPSKEKTAKVFHLTMLDAIKVLTKEKSKDKITKVWKLGHTSRYQLYPLELLKMPKHSKEAIKDLSKDYKLGLVTSRIKEGVRDFFRVSKLQKYFDVVVSFEDYSKPKPDPQPLLVALKKLNVKPPEVVYVGDSKTDIEASKAAGVKIILFSKKHLKGANLTIRSFKNLRSAIIALDQK